MKRVIDLIVLHCSDSAYGDAALIGEWHKARGWKGIGYHFVIGNGYPTEESWRLRRPKFWLDGTVENGRPVAEAGAHVEGSNARSVGICLIGREQFTMGQWGSLVELLNKLEGEFPAAKLLGHYEAQKSSGHKSCPNLDMEWIRQILTTEAQRHREN